ncbi:hypothetical protein [Oricola thermophila]|uniref:Outer membrane lipoprotein n=1 Tax=Oricola thermophila TaxID=2742145 RepID=A0A6N1VN67_9HYPH|nr:hypothetical protein [Oricola thermophila]QKV20387.1 hypothetical protein HTY61_18990 [Oricola thermophila]
MNSRLLAKSTALAGSLLALATLGGCVMDGPPPGYGYGQATRGGGVEGNWSDTGGVATSSFNSGVFVTVANDTGNRLAEGSYRYIDDRNIEIIFTSLVRQQQVRANCLVINPGQMNCTNDAGSQFTLVRRGAIG